MLEELARKYALHNAVLHEGKADPGAVIGKVIAAEPELKSRIKEIIPEKTTFIPAADFVIKDSDILILMGDQTQLDKINKL